MLYRAFFNEIAFCMKLAPVNITNCDKEPIHLIDLIQPCGYQLIYSTAGKLVSYSQNITELYSKTKLPSDITDLLSPTQLEYLLGDPLHTLRETITIKKKQYSLYACPAGAAIIIEIEALSEDNSDTYPLLANRFIRQMEQAPNIPSASLLLAEAIQTILDYDRVMIYAFDDDWNGYVVHEAVKPQIHSYYNHHFPSSDIPVQAREMLLKVRMRQICNVQGTPVPLSIPAESVNFQLSGLRQPSEIHLQFLRNMQVGATLTFSIVVNNKLWGLVCGQHETPVYKDAYRRTLCQNITSIFAQSIPGLNEKKDEARIAEASAAIRKFFDAGAKYDSVMGAIREHLPVMRELVSSTGIAAIADEVVITDGVVPAQNQILQLASTMEPVDDIFYSHRITTHLPPAEINAFVASGILFLRLPENLQLIWFRPEIKLTRTWAGNPEKEITHTSKGLQINPRKSFEAYVEKVKNTAAKWTVTDIAIIKILQKSLDDLQLKLLFNDAVNARNTLRGKIDKMSEISTIIAHDLKNPITNLQLLISLFETDSEADVPWLISQLKNISKSLMENVSNLSNLTELLAQQAIPKKKLLFEEIFAKAKKQLEGHIISTSAMIETDFEANTINYPTVYLESIFSNLLSNAIKYQSPERTPHIKVKTTHTGGFVRLEVEDNGRGIDLNGKGMDTFGLFKTFHNHPQARGIGIYITRSQVESLGGKIEVESMVGKGTRFTIHLKNFTDA